MNSINDALAYHWPFPIKHKKPASLKKQTAYRLGVKLPNELDLEIKALTKGSRHRKPFPRSSLNHKVAESRSIIDNFSSHSSLKHRHSGRALGAVPAHNTDTPRRNSKPDDAGVPNTDGSSEDCRLNLSQLRALFPPSAGAKTTTATRLTQCDSPTFCPMNPYRMVYNSTLSSAHLLLNLKRQQELIDRLNNSSHQLKSQLTSLAVTTKRHESHLAKSEMTLNCSGHSNRHLAMPSALRSLCYTDRTPVNHKSPPPHNPTLSQSLPQALGWRSKSEVLQLPEVDSTVNTTASEAAVNVHNQDTPMYAYMPRPSRRIICKHKKFEPAKYPDPWKGGGRLYRKRLTDLATMVTETLIWEKSKQYKKTKGSSSALFSNN